MIDYADKYIKAVEKGDIVVGNKIQKAIDRHKRDLKREDFAYEYRPEKAQAPIKFISMLPDPKSGKPNKLALFQLFIISMIFGWVHKKTGYRRFNKAYIGMSRKQGKSLLVSGIALYILLYSRNPNSSRQVYTTANKRDQAKIVFNMVKSQLKAIRAKSDATKDFTKIKQVEIVTKDDSYIQPLSTDADTLDGLDTALAVFDEYALSKTTEMMDVIETSMSQQDEPLILIISTASSKLTYPMHSIEYPYIEKILSQEVEADEYLALCWEQDSSKEIKKEKLWMKSNPLLEVGGDIATKVKDNIKKLYQEGVAKGTVSNVLTKHFNLWVQASKESYFTREEWETAYANQQMRNINIDGRKAYFGLDVSRSGDLTSISWVIPIEESKRFLVDSFSFVATKGDIAAKEKEDNTPYQDYERQGYCSITTLESGLIDYDYMSDWLVDFVNEHKLQVEKVAYDPAYANMVVQRLEDKFTLIPTSQRQTILNAPTKQFKYDCANKVTVHLHNPLLDRAVYNAITIERNDLVYIDKQMNRNKIDPLDALINAYNEAMYHDFDAMTTQEMLDEGLFGWGI